MNEINPHASRIKKVRNLMILGFTCIILFVSLFLYILTTRKTDSLLQNMANTSISNLCLYMKQSTDRKLQSIKTTGTLIFASEELYKYDATNTDLDEYEVINTEDSISSTLFNLCLMDNYIDFALVYSNNHTVGKLSNGTIALAGDTLYQDMLSVLSDSPEHDGWCSGYKGDFTRIYYVKKVNENTIFLASIYNTELDSLLETARNTGELRVILTDEDLNILYSPNRNQIGTALPAAIKERVDAQSCATVIDRNYLVSVNTCENGWHIICYTPVSVITSELSDLRLYFICICLIAAVCAVGFSIYLSARLTAPVGTLVTELTSQSMTDQLTTALNKGSFETLVRERLSKDAGNRLSGLILLDIDNFKQVNDTYGHAHGDQVLKKTGHLLNELFPAPALIGRVGGDEFCVFLPEECFSSEDVRAELSARCNVLLSAVSNKSRTSQIENPSISIGAALCPVHGSDFDALYRHADSALYHSKKQGKNRYAIYES